jgi:hypothetical protein
VTEVSCDFIQLLQAFHRLGLNIIFYRSVIKCYVDSILQPLPGTALSLSYPCTKLVRPIADITKVVAEGKFRLLLEIENWPSSM